MVFSRPSDNLLSAATVTLAAGSALAGYPLSNLNVGAWAVPFKAAETTIDIRIDLGSAQALGWVILGNTNLTVAASLQGHTSDVWTSPDISTAFAIPTKSPRAIFTSPYVSNLAAKRYWRIVITSNATPVVIGELGMLGTRREAGIYTRPGVELGAQGQSVEHVTPFGVEMAYELHVRRERVAGSLAVTPTERQAILDLLDATRYKARPFWMLPHAGHTDAWFVRYQADEFLGSAISSGGFVGPFPVRQLSRGLPWEAGV
jgi:hypothetical protein